MPAQRASKRKSVPMNKSQRLIKILEIVGQPQGVLVTELMTLFKIDPRTLRRYLANFRELGIQLQFTGRGEKRRISMDSSYQRRQLTVSLAEMLALRFGRSIVTFLDGTTFADDLDTAILNLASISGDSQEALQSRIKEIFIAVPEPRKRYDSSAVQDIIDDIITALIYDHPLHATYLRANTSTKTYILHPYTLAVHHHALYLLAYDTQDDIVKTFAVERFTTIKRDRKNPFERPANFNAFDYLQHAFGIVSGTPEEVYLRFKPEFKLYIFERIWHDSQQLFENADGSPDLILQVAITPELISWIRSFGPDVEVIWPPSLRERIAADAQAILVRQNTTDDSARTHLDLART